MYIYLLLLAIFFVHKVSYAASIDMFVYSW
jgi:hypothetical protein